MINYYSNNLYILEKNQTFDSFKSVFRLTENERDTKKLVYEITEKEILTRVNGEYFGDWGIIEGNTRKASALTLEDTELFTLDTDSFNSSFGRCMVRAENERKNFILKMLKPLNEINRGKFNTLYKMMFVKFLTKNEVIFIEGDNADLIYIIYDGVFRLSRKSSDKEEGNNELLKSDISKQHTVIKLSKGDLAGLETFDNFPRKIESESETEFIPEDNTQGSVSQTSLSNRINSLQKNSSFFNILTNKPKNKYKYSLVSEDEYNIIFAINPKIFAPDLREKIYKHLKPIIDQKNVILENIVNSYTILKRKMKIVFREEIIHQLIKNGQNFCQNTLNKNMPEIKENFRQCQNINSTGKNNFRGRINLKTKSQLNTSEDRQISVDKSKENTYLPSLPNSSINKFMSPPEKSTKSIVEFSSPFLTEKYKYDSRSEITSEYFNTDGSTRNITQKSQGQSIKKLTVVGRHSKLTKSILNTETFKSKKLSLISDGELNKIITNSSNRLSAPIINTASLEETNKNKNNELNLNQKIKKLKFTTTTNNLIKISISESKNTQKNEKLILNEYVSKSVDMWKKSNLKMDTGNFNMPLITQMKKSELIKRINKINSQY